jgi:hypothetical protein
MFQKSVLLKEYCLMFLIADLRKWNEEVFGNVGRKRKILLE